MGQNSIGIDTQRPPSVLACICTSGGPGENFPKLAFRWCYRRRGCAKLTAASETVHRCTSINHRLTIFVGNIGIDLVEMTQQIFLVKQQYKGFAGDMIHQSPLATFPTVLQHGRGECTLTPYALLAYLTLPPNERFSLL